MVDTVDNINKHEKKDTDCENDKNSDIRNDEDNYLNTGQENKKCLNAEKSNHTDRILEDDHKHNDKHHGVTPQHQEVIHVSTDANQ